MRRGRGWGWGGLDAGYIWGNRTSSDSKVSRRSSAGQAATICNLRSESCGRRAAASCYLTPPALAPRVRPPPSPPPLCQDLPTGAQRGCNSSRNHPNHLRQSRLLPASSDFCNPARFLNPPLDKIVFSLNPPKKFQTCPAESNWVS